MRFYPYVEIFKTKFEEKKSIYFFFKFKISKLKFHLTDQKMSEVANLTFKYHKL
jgi:hypothetical protein